MRSNVSRGETEDLVHGITVVFIVFHLNCLEWWAVVSWEHMQHLKMRGYVTGAHFVPLEASQKVDLSA